MIKHVNKIMIGISIAFVIAYSLILILNISRITNNFFNITISDIINNILTLFIGIIITFFFGVYYKNKHKQFDLIISVLDMYIEDLRFTMKKIHSYIDDPTKYNENRFNYEMRHLLRISSNDLNTFSEMCLKCGFTEPEIQKHKNEFFTLKSCITHRSFTTIDDVKSEYDEIINCYYIIKNSLHLLKLSFYK
ncbi:MAG: hypothetical protein FWD14_07620 [Treponema sp.]|nr:hypothetical protein [Treponema sp.]